jgi:hypothetical protein
MKAWCNKVMDKAVQVGRLLMKRPGVVVPDDIMVDVLATSGTSSKPPASGDPIGDIPHGDGPA